MSSNPFIAQFGQLPDTLPIFPLHGAIVMPGHELPLNIFEPRYLNMVSDALGTHHMFGMIQPDPACTDASGLHRTGCAGRITQYRETRDGRIEMVLSGVVRFDRGEELPTTRGYRLIVPRWTRFAGDYDDQDDLLDSRHGELMQTLKTYFHARELDVDWAMLERLPALRLMNSMCMALPLTDQDKQTLLESIRPDERLDRFMAMLNGESSAPGSATRH